MKKTLIGLTLFLSTLYSSAQLDKKTWLVGGTGSFSSSNDSYTTSTYSQTSKTTEIKLSPAVGYFLTDKFAAGLKTSFSKYKSEVDGAGGGSTNVNRFEVGPFARYYFLPKEKQVNIVTEASYQFGRYSFKPRKGNINTVSFLAGPAIYFNNSVGLEFLVGYKSRTENVKDLFKETQKGLQVAIGFQFHLIK